MASGQATQRLDTLSSISSRPFGDLGKVTGSVMNGYGNAHARCRWNTRSDRDAGDGLVIISANQSIALHDKP